MKKILVETSARHIHVTQEALEYLLGEGATLNPKKMLSQPGQFASDTKLDIVGPKNTIKGVSILGPVRTECQVEVSATDARTLGVKAPIRESGDIKVGTPGDRMPYPAGAEGVFHVSFISSDRRIPGWCDGERTARGTARI